MINRSKKIAKVTTVIIFLALIRTITEPLRLQYYSSTGLMFEQVKPFLIAALITSTSLLIITLLYYYEKYSTIIAIAIVDIIIMVIIKILLLQGTPWQ